MLSFIFELLIWIVFIYGMYSIIQDYYNYNTYKNIKENLKLILTVKDVEDGIEEYIRELTYGKNFFHSLVVIDLDSKDDTFEILKKLEEEKYNMQVLKKDEGEKFLKEMLVKNSFFQ